MLDVSLASEAQIVDLIPEIRSLVSVIEHNAWHDHDSVYAHTMNAFGRLKVNFTFSFINQPQALQSYFLAPGEQLNRKQLLLWSTLLHDIAKPETMVKHEDTSLCPNHEYQGSIKAVRLLRQMITHAGDLYRISDIIKNHGLIHNILSPHNKNLEKDIEAFHQNTRDIYPELLLLGLSDTEGSQLKRLIPEEYDFPIQQYYRLLSNWGNTA